MTRPMYESRPWKAMIENCFAFLNGNFTIDIPMWSDVTSALVVSNDMFVRISRHVYVCRREHFPVDPDLKYVEIIPDHNGRDGRLAIEITMLDFPKVEEKFAETRSGFELHGKQINFRGRPLLKTVTRQRFRVHGRDVERSRTLVSTIGPMADANVEAIGDFFDMVWGYNLCKEDCRPQLTDEADRMEYDAVIQRISREPAGMHMKQIMSLQLQQKLSLCMRQDQVPLLMQQQIMTARMVASLALRGKVLQMSGRQFREYVKQEAAANPAFDSGG